MALQTEAHERKEVRQEKDCVCVFLKVRKTKRGMRRAGRNGPVGLIS